MKRLLYFPLLLGLAACAGPRGTVERADLQPDLPPQLSPQVAAMYGAAADGDRTIPAVGQPDVSQETKREEVVYWSDEKPGTIIVDPGAFHLYYLLGDNRAMRYTVSVGREGYGFSGDATIPYKREWPRWTPTPNMLKQNPGLYEQWRNGMKGGLDNPLGARALYLFQGGKDTLYRIHGTPYPWTIGKATTDGCIRLYNQDIVDLYGRVRSGTKVIVRAPEETGKGTFPPGSTVPPSVAAQRARAIVAAAQPADPATEWAPQPQPAPQGTAATSAPGHPLGAS